MNFSTALRELKKGNKIARKHWGGYWYYCPSIMLKDGHTDNEEWEDIIIAKLKDGGYAPAQPYQADLLANDWKVVE